MFDPLAGSGTLGKSALLLNRNFFLVEKEPKYFQRIQEELEKHINLFNKSNQPKFLTLEEFKKLSKEK